jgi:hypothetical protein
MLSCEVGCLKTRESSSCPRVGAGVQAAAFTSCARWPAAICAFHGVLPVVLDIVVGGRAPVFFNPEQAETCTAVKPVERRVEETEAVATAALNELFKGPTDAEEDRGLTSFFDEGTSGLLRSVHVDGDRLSRSRPRVLGHRQASTTCGGSMVMASIEATLTQFSTVEDVRYAVEGEPSTFYDFMQIGCPRPRSDGDRCDPAPFQP